MIEAWIGSLGTFGKWIALIVVVGTLGLALVGVLLGRNVSLGFRYLATLNVTVPEPTEIPSQLSGAGKHPPDQSPPNRRSPGKKRKETD